MVPARNKARAPFVGQSFHKSISFIPIHHPQLPHSIAKVNKSMLNTQILYQTHVKTTKLYDKSIFWTYLEILLNLSLKGFIKTMLNNVASKQRSFISQANKQQGRNHYVLRRCFTFYSDVPRSPWTVA